jgi:hypothetical protein
MAPKRKTPQASSGSRKKHKHSGGAVNASSSATGPSIANGADVPETNVEAQLSPPPPNHDGETIPASSAAGVTADDELPDIHWDRGNISKELITGDTEAVVPKDDGSFAYVPLVKDKENGDENKPDLIRVLIVHRGNQGTDLECSLKVRLLPQLDLRGNPLRMNTKGIENSKLPKDRYIALSYAWADQKPADGHKIYIRHRTAGRRSFFVTVNLFEALNTMRAIDEDRIFWADAICMDQNNLEEKSEQLTLMSRIYGEASSVCVWLGSRLVIKPAVVDPTVWPPFEQAEKVVDLNAAFHLMSKIRNLDFATVVEDKTLCNEWEAFVGLVSASWFRRRWVVQEIVLARSAELHCGKNRIDWMSFSQAVSLFELLEKRVKKKFHDELPDHPPDMFGEVRELSANRLVQVTNDIVDRHDDGRVAKKTESLETLISSLTTFETGDPRDLVYAVLSLAKEMKPVANDSTRPQRNRQPLRNSENRIIRQFVDRVNDKRKREYFPVEYSKSFDQIIEDLYNFTTKQSGSLDLICRPWCPLIEDPELPSWVRRLDESPFRLDSKTGRVERANADPLVGLPGKSPYLATQNLDAFEWKFTRDGGPKGLQILEAKGFQLDVITSMEQPALAGTVPQAWLDYKSRVQISGPKNKPARQSTDDVSPQFWKTMMAGKGPDGKTPKTPYYLQCQKLFGTQGDINLHMKAIQTTNELEKEFINRILAVVWNRRLTKTSKHKCLAIIPKLTEIGDVICIIYGCSVPVVLRKTEHKTSDDQDLWILIGECYMYGMMFGDALIERQEAFQSDKDFYKLRKFTIK